MAKYPGVSADVLKQLAQYDTPTIANAVELWNRRPRNFGYLNGSCLIPPWTFWDCATGSTYMTFLENGSGYTEGHLAIGNDGWYTTGGTSVGGWFSWQY